MKSFFLISDGLLLRWNIILFGDGQNQGIPLGNMHVNSLEHIVPYDYDSPIDENLTRFKFDKVFVLDSNTADGKVALVYLKNSDSLAEQQDYLHKNPQIWFQDLSLQWHFIANTFTEYFRLLVMHLGLPHWQYAYTQVGIDPLSRQWFRFLIPERLAIDLNEQKRTRTPSTKMHKLDLKKVTMALKSFETNFFTFLFVCNIYSFI